MSASDPNKPSFWRWFVNGDGGKSGLRRIFDGWIAFHLLAGIGLTALIPANLQDAARAFLLPMAAVFVGISFAWGGNVYAILHSEEMEELASRRPGGLQQYIYAFQLTILVVMIAIFFWSLAAVGVFEQRLIPVDDNWYFLNKILLYMLASLAIRACWNVVLGANLLIVASHRIRGLKRNSGLAVSISRSKKEQD